MEDLASIVLQPAFSGSLFPLLVGIAVFGLTYAISLIAVGFSDPFKRRMSRISVDEPKKRSTARTELLEKALEPLSGYVLPDKEWERTSVTRQLVHAGYRSKNAPVIYFTARLLLLVLLPAVAYLISRWMPTWSSMQVIMFILASAFVGFIVPGIVLGKLVAKRQRALRVGFPDALDLLVVCVESGLGLAPAIQRVARELEVSHPALAEELELVSVETRAGVERAEALKNFAERTGLDDIRGLVALLVQTMRFGTSVADALRVYSEEFRDKRMQAAEEIAAKIGTKMIFPLVTCLFPSFFLVAVGPAVLRLMEAFAVLGQ